MNGVSCPVCNRLIRFEYPGDLAFAIVMEHLVIEHPRTFFRVMAESRKRGSKP